MASQRFKASAIVPVQRVGEVLALFTSLSLQVTFTPVAENPALGIAPTKGDAGTLARHTNGNGRTDAVRWRGTNIRIARPKLTRVKGGAKPSETPRGKVILSVINNRRVVRFGDIQEAIEKAGFSAVGSLMNELIKEGRVVQEGRGIYRLPSTTESLRNQQVQDPSFTG